MVVLPAHRTSGAAGSPKSSTPSVTPFAFTVLITPDPSAVTFPEMDDLPGGNSSPAGRLPLPGYGSLEETLAGLAASWPVTRHAPGPVRPEDLYSERGRR